MALEVALGRSWQARRGGAHDIVQQVEPARAHAAELYPLRPEGISGNEAVPALRDFFHQVMGNGQIELQVARIGFQPVVGSRAVNNIAVTCPRRGISLLRLVAQGAAQRGENEDVPCGGVEIIEVNASPVGEPGEGDAAHLGGQHGRIRQCPGHEGANPIRHVDLATELLDLVPISRATSFVLLQWRTGCITDQGVFKHCNIPPRNQARSLT